MDKPLGVGQILCGNAYLMDITVKSLFESHDLFYLLFSWADAVFPALIIP